MDSTGFPPHNMGGPGQMMQQQQRPPQQQQRPGPGGNATQHIQQMIYSTVTNQTGPLSGWQAQVQIQERIGLIFSIIGNLRLASAGQSKSPGLQKMIEIGIRFEKEIFDKSPDKAVYKRSVDEKLQQLLERRNQNQAGMQLNINQQAQYQAQAQQHAQAQMMMNQNGMQGQAPRAMPQQPAQQGFQHLQHQMQASPLQGQQLPGQQQRPQQMGMGMGNDSMAPNMAQSQQQQFQISMQQAQQAQQQQQQQQQQQSQLIRPQNGQPMMGSADQAMVMDLANRLMNQASMEEKAQLRERLVQSMAPNMLQDIQQRGTDPLIMYFRQQALQRLRNDKQQRMAQAQAQQLAMSQQGQNVPSAAPPMQQQRSMNPSPLNGQPQPPASMAVNNEFGGFMGNMDNLAAQQKQAALAAEAGQVVVPASGTQRNSTPQPGALPGVGMNGQQGIPGAMNRAQQQQIPNGQQMQQQQQRLQAQQQQNQAQAQARLNAHKQMALQGQPGGMGNGPMPPQQSPALPTLNAPMRTPSQVGHQETPQINATQQFGQQLDPRFAQANNQRLMGPGAGMNPGLNHQMFAGMSREQQQKLIGLPADKLQEVLMKLNEQRQMSAANIQAGRPQMPQANNQMHPGVQMPQFNQPGGPFGMAGQRPTQLNPSTITPAQNLVLQEQIARLNPQQRPGMPQPNAQMEQQIVRQMDSMEYPPALLNHGSFPRTIPPELKKWGQVKAWVQGNAQNLGPETAENIRQLQRVHYQTIMRTRAHAQAGGIQGGIQGGQGSMPMGAPVAPMSQNNMRQPPGMNMPGAGPIREPTAMEIQNARAHPSGKMANASDDQIRIFLIRNQQMQRQSQAQMLQNLQMQNQMAQMNNQQPRPGQQPPNPNARVPLQAPSTQPQPSKQLPVNPNPSNTGNNAQNANRNARSAANATQSTAPNSSPAQPPKSLKRQPSDDVIEVPNPHLAQPQRPVPQRPVPQQTTQQNQQAQQANVQQAQNQKQAPPPGRPNLNLTKQQVEALNPEARQKYEDAMGRLRAEQKVRAIMAEEQQKADNEPFVVVPMSAEQRAAIATSLKEISQPMFNMTKAMSRYYIMSKDENKVRVFFTLRCKIAKQYHDPIQMTQLKDALSFSQKDIDSGRVILNSMISYLSQANPNMRKSQPTGPQTAPTPQPAPGSGQAPSIPLNAANLQEQQQQLNKMHQRSTSRSHGPPAAPTQAHAPYQFGGGKSPPDGVPAYANVKTNVTQENLQLPAHKNKKQKQNSNTPGQNTSGIASPQVAKTISPDMKRQHPEPKPQAKSTLCCPEPECDRHNIGFDTEEALKQHTQEEHIKPLSDPTTYAQQNLASLLGLDAQGRSQKTAATQHESVAPTAPKMVTSGSKQGQTPNVKAGNTPVAAATPMNRQISMNRQGSAPGARPGTPSKGTPLKDVASNFTVPKQANQPTQEVVVEDPWANTTIDPHDIFQAFQPFESGAGGAISDMNVYRSITPNDTPESSKDSGVSEPNSDISEGVGLDINIDLFEDTWMPFGPSDTETFFDLNNYGSGNQDSMLFEDPLPTANLQWDDVVDQSAFDKPFSFDTSYYSMNAD